MMPVRAPIILETRLDISPINFTPQLSAVLMCPTYAMVLRFTIYLTYDYYFFNDLRIYESVRGTFIVALTIEGSIAIY